MFWNYTRFETKLLLHNRKSWFIAVFLLLFFLVFFIYDSRAQPQTLIEQKRVEKEEMNIIFENVEYMGEELPVMAKIHENLLKQSSLINFQVYYLGIGDDSEQYIENGLELNQLRLQVHELGNKGIPKHLIKSKEEILKEDALLHYMKEHQMTIEESSFLTNHFFTNALNRMSGLLLLIIILICGSELLLYEKVHETITKGFPLSFFKKVGGKITVYFCYIYVLLIMGFLIGMGYIVTKLQAKDFSFPILIYKNHEYIAVSIWQYLIYIFVGMALVTVLILIFSILLNMLFQNAFANLLVGIGIYFLPDLVHSPLLSPIKYIDIASCLSGDLAVQLGSPSLDWGNAMVWLAGITFLLIGCIYAINQYMYIRKPKDKPLLKPF
ncbi:hypothetical protein [Robertmurraya andreesenii]|uniref:ABC-2 family transporter protein n=1 Tax=Anoxybacillus andreesenii TaxID=1325932 RepID=A0ABT9V459_9BACL|nr:hypothetical protein [Robertmurraya andreesenii]MDQ0155734.1 hypothetical protein [Robertmurraya andreesenii]